MAAALLVLALVPGYAQAAGPNSTVVGTLDQSTDLGVASRPMLNAAFQTFTPAMTGMVTDVYLYCGGTGDVELPLIIVVGGEEAHADCGATAGWVDVPVRGAQVFSGNQATIEISGGAAFDLIGAATDYTGGEATDESGDPIPGFSDFAFRTYVYGAATTTYEWSVPAVAAGSTSTVTLTATTTFDDIASNVVRSLLAGSADPNDGDTGFDYSVTLETLPSWFTPTGISCSTQIAAGDCTLDKFKSGIHVRNFDVSLPLVVVVTGQAAPAAADGGTAGFARGGGCLEIIGKDVVLCSATATAGLDVTRAAAAPTPSTAPTTGPTTVPTIPPTSATTPSTSDGGLNWWLPGGLLALLCSLFVVARTRVRRSL